MTAPTSATPDDTRSANRISTASSQPQVRMTRIPRSRRRGSYHTARDLGLRQAFRVADGLLRGRTVHSGSVVCISPQDHPKQKAKRDRLGPRRQCTHVAAAPPWGGQALYPTWIVYRLFQRICVLKPNGLPSPG